MKLQVLFQMTANPTLEGRARTSGKKGPSCSPWEETAPGRSLVPLGLTCNWHVSHPWPRPHRKE